MVARVLLGISHVCRANNVMRVMSLILIVEDFLKSLTQDIKISCDANVSKHQTHLYVHIYKYKQLCNIYIFIFSLIYFGFEDLLFHQFFFLVAYTQHMSIAFDRTFENHPFSLYSVIIPHTICH